MGFSQCRVSRALKTSVFNTTRWSRGPALYLKMGVTIDLTPSRKSGLKRKCEPFFWINSPSNCHFAKIPVSWRFSFQSNNPRDHWRSFLPAAMVKRHIFRFPGQVQEGPAKERSHHLKAALQRKNHGLQFQFLHTTHPEALQNPSPLQLQPSHGHQPLLFLILQLTDTGYLWKNSTSGGGYHVPMQYSFVNGFPFFFVCFGVTIN